MPPQFALLICVFLILYLFWVDLKKKGSPSRATWIPFCWMFLSGSRYVSVWLSFKSPVMSGDSAPEGSPLDAAIFLMLILIGIRVLQRRKIDWESLLIQNVWIVLFFIFAAISTLWADYPVVSFKRWIKALGNVVMALIILTEQRPYEVCGIILKRLSITLLPLSVLFIKYYPDLGRSYHMGLPMFTGVSMQKNGLGQLCLLAGIYLSWCLLLNRHKGIEFNRQLDYGTYLILFLMFAWLLHMSSSATALACVIVAFCLFVVSRLRSVSERPYRILVLGIVVIMLFGTLEILFDVKGTVITALGRDSSLTTRVPMWEDALSLVKNPIVGTGYESFWVGERLEYMRNNWGGLHQVHNGYLELYLNLGLIGLFILGCWFVSGVRSVVCHLVIDYPAAILKLCLILVVALYNWTEATFYGVSNMWVLFLLGTMDVPIQQNKNTWQFLRKYIILKTFIRHPMNRTLK